MKIAFLFSPWGAGNRPLDFKELWTSSRGLTGSDLGIAIIAKEMVKRGHEVSLFTFHTDPANKLESWEGVKLYNFEDAATVIKPDWDAVISWNEPDALRGISKKPLRICNQMLNDFTYCKPGFDDFVDVWCSPCQMHMEHLKKTAPDPKKWTVLPLGCEPSWYKDGPRVPGRVVWTSSADRGLHLLLQEWPKIKAAVPEAHLKVFYNFNYSHIENLEFNDQNTHPHVKEIANRARYMMEMMKRLKPLGVEHVGSISRARMEQELSEAMVLAYPVSTVAFTEGFSISIMESCAAGVFPVISDADCLGSIYGGTVPMVKSPAGEHMAEFDSLVIKGLTDSSYRSEVIDKCKKFSLNYTWTSIAEKLETLIKKYPEI
jgi:glycosyltransferase involved in cell wall biosynthesis